MAIGRISGSVLKSNLTRNGVDLAFETNLLYLDVTNSRVGIGTSEPSTALHVVGDTTITGTLNISGALTAGSFSPDSISVNNLSSADSTAIQINDAVNVSGTLTANTIQTNSLSSTESTAIQVNDSLNASGTITATSFVTHGASGNITGVNNIELNQISSNDSTAVQVADGMNVSGTLTAPTFVTNDISSGDSTAIQINDAVNISGTLNAKIIVTNNISSEDSTAIQINDAVNVSGSLTANSGFIANAITYPTTDGSNGQVLQTDGAGNLSFADAGGGGGGNNTATRQFNHLRLTTSSAVIDEFDIEEYRAAVYHISTEDVTNSLTGMTTLSVVHDGSTAYSNQHESNEDSTNLALFSVAISGTKVQISAQANAQSSHVNLRLYRIALGDHHDTVANTNSKIIVTNTGIGSTAVTLDQFTKTDIQGAKYYILIKDTTAGQYQLSEMSVVHDGTTVFFNDYAKVLTNLNQETTFSADISGSTVNLKAISGGSTTGTAIMYRVDLGSSTKLGEYDGMLYGKAGDVDSAAQTIDSFDALERRSAKYLVTVANTETGTYQNSEITMVTDGINAYITESVVLSGSNSLTTFTADVSGGRARLRAAGSPANNEIYFARLSSIKPVIYRATNHTADNFYLDGANIQFHDTLFDLSGTTGAIILPSGSSSQQPTGQAGMLRYNTSLSRYEKWDGTSFVDILATTAAASDTSNISLPTPSTGIGTTITTIDSFTTGAFDSAYYYAVTRDEINNETHTGRYTLVHNNSNAFVSHSNGVQSGSNDQIAVTADINAGTVRLRATGSSVVNSVSLYRIALGDSTTAGTAGNTSTIINTDVDSDIENLDTWSASTYRGAKYFISVNAEGITELSNLEAVVVHNGSDAYITIYNEINTGNNSLITLTADISGGLVRLRGTGNMPNLRVTMYRILLGDSETTATGDNTKTVGASSVSSSATSIDTFSTESFTGAQYVVVGYNSAEGAASISEVHVITDGSDAYVSSGPMVSTKGSDQLTFTAALSGTTVTLSAASTSGSSTTVNAFRVSLLRTSAGASTSETVLISPAQTITGQKTFSSEVVLNSISSIDSTAVQINDGLTVSGAFTANTIQTNNISSSESSAIQINDAVNISGSLTAADLRVAGAYGNSYITTFASMFIDGTSTNNIVQVSSLDRDKGMGMWSTGGGAGRLYSVDAIEFRTGVTLRDRDTPTGGSTKLTIAADGAATFSNTLTANTFVTNEISSADSSAIQINDGVNVSGAMSVSGSYQVNGKQAVNGPAFRAYIATGQTITSGSQQKVTFGSETFDTNGNFASSTFTPNVEGYYQLNATVRISGSSGTGEVMITIWKNGSEYSRGTNEQGTEQGNNFYSMQVSDIAYANGTTDYFEIYIQQTSGGSRDTTAGSNISYFSGSMIRGA
jgi:hypothetical protein